MVIVQLRGGETVQVDGGASVRTHMRRPIDPPTYGAGNALEVLLVCDIVGEVLREFDRSKVKQYIVN